MEVSTQVRQMRSPLIEEGLLSGFGQRLASDEGLEGVEALMRTLAAGSRADFSAAMLQEHLSTGGHRVRARLALAALEAFGHTRLELLGWGAACELLHNATLVHDDLQDGDRVRRGQPTVWARHGAAQAINAGDLLLMLPFLALEHLPVPGDVRWRLSRAIAHRAECTVRGQSLEMSLKCAGRMDWDSYLEAVEGKTGALIALPVEGAALIAGQPARQAAGLAQEFLKLGVLFQLQDDVLDLYGDKGRGERGADLREGKVSALVVEHLRLHPHDRTWLTAILDAPRDQTRESDVLEAIHRFHRGGALRGVIDRIETITRDVARSEALEPFPHLLALAGALVAQTLQPISHLAIDPREGFAS